MDIPAATAAFAAIAQDYRLRVFKRLMKIAPEGLTAGDIARELGIPPSTLSTHLAQLQRAGLLRSWRHQRHIFYTIDMDGTRRLVDYLINDCCRGHPELCGFDRRHAQEHYERPRCKPDNMRPPWQNLAAGVGPEHCSYGNVDYEATKQSGPSDLRL